MAFSIKLFKSFIVLLLLGSSTLYADSAKVVYDLTSGDITKIKKHLIKSVNAVSDYYKSQNKEFDATVVISGDAYKFFIQDLKNSPYADDVELQKMQAEIKPLLEKLHSNKHVVYNMCESGMKARKIKKETLYKFVYADAMKSVYLINAQNKGYAYMPIH